MDVLERDVRMLEDILTELRSAREKFPVQDLFTTLAALSEEDGELHQACLQLKFEPKKGKTPQDVYAEAVQVAAMAIRVALDCGVLPDG